MKKLFVLALAAFSMVACVNEEITETIKGDEIAFGNTFVENATRAGELTATNLQDFAVWGFVKEAQNMLFDGDKVEKQGEEWSYEGKQYWLPDEVHYFTAVAPYGAVTADVESGKEGKLNGFTYTITDGNTDLLYATTQQVGAGVNGNNAPVNLTFNHILSRVTFSFTNGYDTTNGNNELVVKNVTLKGAQSADYNGNAWEQHTPATEALRVAEATDRIALNGSAQTAAKFVIPTAGSYTIAFDVDVYFRGSTTAVYTASLTSEVSGVALEAGHAYNFSATITPESLQLGEIVFAPTEGEWNDNQGGNQIDIVSDGIVLRDGKYYIFNAAGLKWFADKVNAFDQTMINAHVVLADNIDLASINNWTPISMSTDLANGKNFRGTFDGNYKTISNLTCTNTEVVGLFGYIYSATIKNVTIKDATLNSNHYAGGIVAWVLNNKGNLQVPFVLENCHVKNSTITSIPNLQADGKYDNGDKVGGLVGYADFTDNTEAVISNCSVENTTVSAYRDLGSLVGYAKDVTLQNCTTSNVTIEQDLTHDYKAPNTPTTIGGIIGRNEGGNTVDGRDYVTDGVTIAEGNYYISNAAGLKWVAEQVNTMEFYVNQSANIFDGKTVYLTNDIDLGGAEWRPIGDYAFSRTSFNGTFDGQGYTVSNFQVTEPVRWTEKVSEASYGFFGNVKGTIKNLTIQNATINPDGGRYSAVLVGRLHNGGNVENCHVIDSSATILHWQVGGLVGQNNNGNIKGCSVVRSTITGKAAVGALVGMDMTAGEHSIENCRVANTALVQNASFGASYDASYGLVVGLVNASGIILNLKDIVVENNTIKGVASDTLVGDVVEGATIKINGATVVNTAEALTAAIEAGCNCLLVGDIELGASITISNANFTLDGQGHTITMAENATNTYALFDITGGKATFKNVTFDGIKSGAVVRTVGVEFEAENVTAKNGAHTQQQGLFRLSGKSTIKNCTFKNNTCSMVITLNYDDDANNDPQVVENCVFEGNTCNGTAVLYYVTGEKATINGNRFVGNTVNCNGNGATIYMGFTENNTVTNNLSQNNTVNEASTSSRVAGGVFFGYETVFTGNAFTGNTVTGANAKGNDVCVSTYYTSIDLSGNYWGGNAPVEDTNYFVQHKSDERVVIINDYLTANPFN